MESKNSYSSDIKQLARDLFINRKKIPNKNQPEGPVTFTAKEFINYMLKNHNPQNLNRDQMILFIREQLSNTARTTRLLYPVDHTAKFKCGGKKYRMLPDHLEALASDPNVLNVDAKHIREVNQACIDNKNADSASDQSGHPKAAYFFEDRFASVEALNNMEILVREIQMTMLRIKGQTIDPETFKVDYAKLDQLEDFRGDFQRLVELLPFVDLRSLVESKRVNLAFFVNLYNILTIHSLVTWKRVKGRLTMTDWEKTDYFNLFKYCIAGYLFSLNDIEHGILRGEDNFGNSKMRVIFAGMFTDNFSDKSRKRFDKYDGRKQLVLTDDRIGRSDQTLESTFVSTAARTLVRRSAYTRRPIWRTSSRWPCRTLESPMPA